VARQRRGGVQNQINLALWIKRFPPNTMVASEELPGGNSTTRLAYVRDKDYYFEDGSIIVLAEDRLFKVKKFAII
jgi:hypothetical protein